MILFYNKYWLCLYDMRMNKTEGNSGDMEPKNP